MKRKPVRMPRASIALRSSSTIATILSLAARRRASAIGMTSPSNSPIFARLRMRQPAKSPRPVIGLGPTRSASWMGEEYATRFMAESLAS